MILNILKLENADFTSSTCNYPLLSVKYKRIFIQGGGLLQILEILKSSVLFGQLETEQLKTLAGVSQLLKYSKGQTIFEEGIPASGIFIVGSGKVKVVKTSTDGKEQILHVFGSGEPVGEAAAFAGSSFPASCVAVTKTEICRVSRNDLLNMIKAQPQLALDLLAVLYFRLQHFNKLLTSLSLDAAPVRIAKYIHDRFETQTGSKLELNITKHELARNLGMTPETLSRTIKKMKNDGILSVEGRKVQVLDRERLERFIQ